MTICEWKGQATYFTLRRGEAIAVEAAWSYPNPNPAFAAIKEAVARSSADRIGAIAGDLAAVEEMYALKQLMASLGSAKWRASTRATSAGASA